ncbi:MAG: HAD family hydrolase [Acidimicrobiia bacterium]
MTSLRFEAITFDYWNTLIAEDHSRHDRQVAAWQAELSEAGYSVTVEQVQQSFAEAWKAYEQRWEANVQTRFVDIVEVVLGALEIRADSETVEHLVAIQANLAAEQEMPLIDGVEKVLAELIDRGVRIGIVCDVGVTPSPVLRTRLERNGVLESFDHWSFSDEVGVYKPDRRIFEHAMAGLEMTDASRMAHVGDLRRTDIAGARGMGMTSVRFRGVVDDPVTDENPHEGDHVIDRHDQLLNALGLV